MEPLTQVTRASYENLNGSRLILEMYLMDTYLDDDFARQFRSYGNAPIMDTDNNGIAKRS